MHDKLKEKRKKGLRLMKTSTNESLSKIYIIKPIFCRQKNSNDWLQEYQQKQHEYQLTCSQVWYEKKQRALGKDFLYGVGMDRYFSSLSAAMTFIEKEAELLHERHHFNWVLLGESELNDPQAHLSFKWLNLYYYQPRFQGFRRYPKNMSQSARYIMDEWNAWSIENTENQKVFG